MTPTIIDLAERYVATCYECGDERASLDEFIRWVGDDEYTIPSELELLGLGPGDAPEVFHRSLVRAVADVDPPECRTCCGTREVIYPRANGYENITRDCPDCDAPTPERLKAVWDLGPEHDQALEWYASRLHEALCIGTNEDAATARATLDGMGMEIEVVTEPASNGRGTRWLMTSIRVVRAA